VKPVPLATAHYPLTGGVDTKIHGLVLPPPKLQECQNAYAEQTGSLRRRFGRRDLPNQDVVDSGSLMDFMATGLHRGRLLGYEALKAWEFSQDDDRWVNKGSYVPWHVDTQGYPTGARHFASPVADMAALGDYRCFVYDYQDGVANRTFTVVTILDSKGTNFGARTLTSAASLTLISGCRVVAFGSRFYVVYQNVATSNNLNTFIIDCTDATTIAASLTGPPVVTTTVAKVTAVSLGGLRPVFDLQVDPVNGPFLALSDNTVANTIKHGFIDTAGALVNSATFTTTAPPQGVACASDSSGAFHGFVYYLKTFPNDIFAVIRLWVGGVGPWNPAVTSGPMETALTSGNERLIACIFEPNDLALRIFYDNTSTSTVAPRVIQATFTTGGLLTSHERYLVHSFIAAQPFKGPDNQIYYWVQPDVGKVGVQNHLYLMRYDGLYMAACEGLGPAVLRRDGLCPPHVVQQGSKFLTFNQEELEFRGTRIMRQVSVDTDPPHSLVGVEDGATTILPGGFIQQYDGVAFTEVGFAQFMEMRDSDFTEGVGGFMDAGLYAYRVIPEWVNAVGEREQGTDAGPVTFEVFDTTGPRNASVSIKIKTMPWTRKNADGRQMLFSVFRSLKNPTAQSPHYLVGSMRNDPTVDTVTFVDILNDDDIQENRLLYSDNELDHVAPEAGSIVAAGNGRVFIAGVPSDPNVVEYSKLRGHGQALSFNDGLIIPVPQSTGVITGLAVFNESLIVFTETAVYRVSGEGTNNTGTAGGYSTPVLIQSDCGALGQRSICVTPLGVMFESPKGKMMMRANFSVEYVGAPLEHLVPLGVPAPDPGRPMGTTMIPALQQVRFSYADITHVFDYYHGQWYTFTHGADGPTSVWNEHLAAAKDDVVCVDDETLWSDGFSPYSVRIRLAWAHGETLRNDVQVRKFAITGQALDDATLVVYVAKNQEGWNQFREVEFTTGALMFETRVLKQVCSQMELTITDESQSSATAHQTAGWRLNEVTFELALRAPQLGREA